MSQKHIGSSMCFWPSFRSESSRMKEATRALDRRQPAEDLQTALLDSEALQRHVTQQSSRATAGFSSVSRSVAARGYRITETSPTASAEKLRAAALSRPNPSPLKQSSAICRRPSVRRLLMRTVPEMTLYQEPSPSPWL